MAPRHGIARFDPAGPAEYCADTASPAVAFPAGDVTFADHSEYPGGDGKKKEGERT